MSEDRPPVPLAARQNRSWASLVRARARVGEHRVVLDATIAGGRSEQVAVIRTG